MESRGWGTEATERQQLQQTTKTQVLPSVLGRHQSADTLPRTSCLPVHFYRSSQFVDPSIMTYAILSHSRSQSLPLRCPLIAKGTLTVKAHGHERRPCWDHSLVKTKGLLPTTDQKPTQYEISLILKWKQNLLRQSAMVFLSLPFFGLNMDYSDSMT